MRRIKRMEFFRWVTVGGGSRLHGCVDRGRGCRTICGLGPVVKVENGIIGTVCQRCAAILEEANKEVSGGRSTSAGLAG